MKRPFTNLPTNVVWFGKGFDRADHMQGSFLPKLASQKRNYVLKCYNSAFKLKLIIEKLQLASLKPFASIANTVKVINAGLK